MRLILLLLFSLNLFSQQKKLDTVFCDCPVARIVNISGKTIVGKTIAPKGFGEIKEISSTKQKTKFSFENEHHSAWYKIIIQTNGELTFDIIPTKPTDDYDYMLFASGPNFCDSLQKHRIHPIRACISRDKEELLGKTGLSFKANELLVKHGIGAAYCKSLAVKKGEVYYLVLDNVYENGDGHTIEFVISQAVTVKGIITDENKKPIKAEIALTNQKGDTVLIENSKEDGSYSFTAPLIKNQSYSLNFYNDSNFTYTKTVSLADSVQLKSLKTVLSKLKKGSKYSVGAINFVPGSVQYLPQATPAMQNLYKLLSKNKNLKIKIIGHSNGRDLMSDKDNIKFTIGRATSIKNYLAIKGIDEKRIELEGKGDHEMLYQLPKATEAQQIENRRVEIMVLEF